MAPSVRPKVILDIAALGYVWDQKKGARGIHRVAEMLLKGLVESDQCDLRFVATSSLAGAFDLLGSKGLSPEKRLGYESLQLSSSRWGRSATQWVHRRMEVPGLGARVERRLISTLGKIALMGEAQVPARFLEGADIYHSPISPLPERVLRHPRITPFLTIHDLLPLSHPEILGQETGPYIRKLLDSISPRSFVFTVSEHVKTDVLTFTGMDPQRIFVTPLAADPATFFPVTDAAALASVRDKYAILEAPYFLTLSAFDPRKNFGHVIHCFQQLLRSREMEDACLVIVGSNPNRHRMVEEAFSENPEVRHRVLMPGFIPDEDLAALYSGALAFLFPSLGEGFGLPVLEAIQCGTPVISSNATSLPEVLGNAGILLDPRDVDGWCAAMISLQRNSDLRQTLQTRGLERARLFTWANFIERTLAGYRAALA
jgi:glycosyltransferase involved in cell wall biosynthesis